MKFYRHYKNKPYKYWGIAKHSETLEDLVIYECRYPNELATVWVRPKDMFFSDIELQGKNVPRFAKVNLEIREITQVQPQDIELISKLSEQVLGSFDSAHFLQKFDLRKKHLLLLALIDGQPVAFKLGYEFDSSTFYSWIGGVLPEYQGLGIASDLMKLQHDWCQKQGYEKIQTKTQNKFREMLSLNINAGFNIIALEKSRNGEDKIVLEKTGIFLN